MVTRKLIIRRSATSNNSADAQIGFSFDFDEGAPTVATPDEADPVATSDHSMAKASVDAMSSLVSGKEAVPTLQAAPSTEDAETEEASNSLADIPGPGAEGNDVVAEIDLGALDESGVVEIAQKYGGQGNFKLPLLTRDQELSLIAKAKAGDLDARNQMILHNVGLAQKEASVFLASGMGFDDLWTEGVFGIAHAIEKFDPSFGTKFSTYATWWAKQAIRRAVHDQSREIRLPAHAVQEVQSAVLAVKATAPDTPEREAAEKKLAEANKRTNNLYNQTHRLSTNDNYGASGKDDPDSDFFSIENIVEDLQEHTTPEDLVAQDQRKKVIGQLMDRLKNDKHRTVIIHRFGLDGHEEKTLPEIGEMLKITRERARQLQEEALTLMAGRAKKLGLSMSDVL